MNPHDPDPSIETISSDEPFQAVRRQRGRGFGGLGARTTALTTAAALVVAGGVATAAYRSSQHSTDPTALIPSSAFGVAVLDLGLPGGQDEALRTFADHFPGSPTRTGDGSAVDRLLRAMFSGSDPKVDYDADLEPWLGDRVAVAGWLDSSGAPRLEALLESTDDAKARTGIARLMRETGDSVRPVFRDGYAVLSDTTAHATAALQAADRRSLADTGAFARDVAHLPADEALLGWLDGPTAERALQSALGGMLPRDLFGGSGFGPSGFGAGFGASGMFGLAGGKDPFAGRVALGAHVADDFAQLDLVSFGAPAAKTAPATLLSQLPASTVGALEIADPGPVVGQVTRLLRAFDGFGDHVRAGCLQFLPSPTAVMPKVRVPKGIPHRRAILREMRQARHRALAQARAGAARSGSGNPAYSSTCTTGPKPASPLEAFRAATGLSLPGDVQTLLGTGAVVAFGGLHLTALPDVAVRSQPRGLSAAQAVAERLRARLSAQHLVDLGVQAAGQDLVLATSDGYAQQVAQAGEFGSQPQVQKALGALPARVGAAGYVDLSRLWPLFGSHVPEGVRHLKAVGFWSDGQGSVQHLQLRLVVG
ncbi:MAG TPA: hypothetical protein VFT62_08420 [Mycobacteriales bacterium]|nr:hypothetical protein [Mycobacteriales bacterium]